MAQRTTGVRRLLSAAPVYDAFQRVISTDASRSRFVDELVAVTPGDRLIDLGCGNGRLLEQLPAVDYVGVDPSEAYIAAAVENFGERGTFRVGTAEDLDPTDGQFDVAVARGVLHHLDDDQVISLAAAAANVLRPGGRLVTLDPCMLANQRRVAREFASRDRGQNVREPEEYRALVAEVFEEVSVVEYHDLLRIPYDHAALVATRAG